MGSKPLWTCPKCRAKFVTRNMPHSCGRATLADWIDDVGPRGRALYEAFEAVIAACGPYHVAPAKTRIAFLGRVRFAGVTRLSDASITVSFALPAPLRSRRFQRVVEVAPGWFVHRLVITDARQFDRQARAWFRRSYQLMGMQGRLQKRATERERS
jgi:hypothetical protein